MAIQRQIVIDIDDDTPLQFEQRDLDEIKDDIEDALRNNYDIRVTRVLVREPASPKK